MTKTIGTAFAPSNIALIKYWGKRDQRLNLPVTDSLSISLGHLGAHTEVELSEVDGFYLNDTLMPADLGFSQRLTAFLDRFRSAAHPGFTVRTRMNIPLAAGVASSACGFAALVLALDDLFGWGKSKTELSVLARLGSGSACRSLWQGFVHWHQGELADGSDSFATSLDVTWPELCVGLHLLTTDQKPVGSREAMQRTVETSTLYQNWPAQVEADLAQLQTALQQKDFTALGTIAERNAMAMHATMHDSQPPVNYDLPDSIALKKQLMALREKGLEVYFTQDAGPNIKTLFLEKDAAQMQAQFPEMVLVRRNT